MMDELATTTNPLPDTDYIITLESKLAVNGTIVRLCVRYVPDRAVLDEAQYQHYVSGLTRIYTTQEALAATLLHVLNNSIIPRFLHVGVYGAIHSVVVEDRQPRWDNDRLLSRLALI